MTSFCICFVIFAFTAKGCCWKERKQGSQISGAGRCPCGSRPSRADAALWTNKITLMNRGGLVYSPCQGTLGVTDCQKREQLWRWDMTPRYPEGWNEKRKSNHGFENQRDSEINSTLYLQKTPLFFGNNWCLQRIVSDLMAGFDLEQQRH